MPSPGLPAPRAHRVFVFPEQSPGFTHGFACGVIWHQMVIGQPVIRETVLAATRPAIEAMAMARGWVEEFTELGDGWLSLVMKNPHRGKEYR